MFKEIKENTKVNNYETLTQAIGIKGISNMCNRIFPIMMTIFWATTPFGCQIKARRDYMTILPEDIPICVMKTSLWGINSQDCHGHILMRNC